MTLRNLMALALLAACSSGEPGYYEQCDAELPCDEALSEEEGLRCINVAWSTEVSGRQCSVECEVNDDCPEDGTCLSLQGGVEQAICYRRCDTEADCSGPGFICADAVRNDVVLGSFCLPAQAE